MKNERETRIDVMADEENKILFITRKVADCLKTNISGECVATYFAFKTMFPDFKDVVVPTIGTVIVVE